MINARTWVLSCSNYGDDEDLDNICGIDDDNHDASDNESEQTRNADKQLPEVREEVFRKRIILIIV